MEGKRQLDAFAIFTLGLFAFSLYFFIITYLQTKPVSDFGVYYHTALSLMSGEKLANSNKYFQAPGFFYILKILFETFKSNSILIPQIFNALFLTFISLLIMYCNFVHRLHLKLIGFFIAAFNLNYLSMISILCSEIPYGVIFVWGLLLAWFGFKEIQRDSSSRKMVKAILTLFTSGIALGVSQSIRPTTTPFILLFSLIFLFGLNYFSIESSALTLKEKGATVIRFLLPIWIGFLVAATSIYYASGYGLTFQPLQSGLWNMYVGFNPKSKGQWNAEDSGLIGTLGDKYNWNADEINRALRPILFERLKKNGLKNLKVLPQKLHHFLNPKDILYWSIEQSKVTHKGMLYRISGYLVWINGFVLIVSILAWITWWMRRNISKEGFFAFCMVGAVFSNFLLHAYLLEVQPRYANHLWLILFWFCPMCLWVLWNNLSNKILWRNRA
jgi:hypothetical protein